MVKIGELERLLNSTSLQQIENSIVDKIGCDLYGDDLSILVGFLKEEVDSSMLSIKEIEIFLENNLRLVSNFAIKFLEKFNPQSLSKGIAITYSIYLIYLIEKDQIALIEYLKRRRIPKWQKLLEQLLSIKKEMSL